MNFFRSHFLVADICKSQVIKFMIVLAGKEMWLGLRTLFRWSVLYSLKLRIRMTSWDDEDMEENYGLFALTDNVSIFN